MSALMAAVVTGLLAVSAAEEPAQALARGKLESDLGRHAAAAEAFAAVAHAPGATVPQRWEALVRLGAARREVGDAKGSAAAFEEAFRDYGRDQDALRFLILALGGAAPGRERWDEVWRQVIVYADRRAAEKPTMRVRWPGVPSGLCPCTGAPVDLDFADAGYEKVLPLIADISGMNVVVHPGTDGRVTYRASRRPWDEALEQMLAPNGHVARVQGNVVLIGRPDQMGDRRSFAGAPVSVDFVSKDLTEALQEIAARGGATVDVAKGVMGRVTLKLDEVPWDQALDLLAGVNTLAWTRTGDVIHVFVRPRSRALSSAGEPEG